MYRILNTNQSPSRPQAAQIPPSCPSPLALKSVLPPRRDSQINHLGTLAALDKPKWHPRPSEQ